MLVELVGKATLGRPLTLKFCSIVPKFTRELSSQSESELDSNAIPSAERVNQYGRATIFDSRDIPAVYANEWVLGATANSRFHPNTLLGKARLPSIRFSKQINQIIGGSPSEMKKIRRMVRYIYECLYSASRDPLALSNATQAAINRPHRGLVDAHIAALFPQSFSSVQYALSEARRRLGPSWRPKQILDIGHGPATGILALNEVFEGSDSYNPDRVVSVVYGDMLMARRGMELLRAQKIDHDSKKYNNDSFESREVRKADDFDSEEVIPSIFSDEEHLEAVSRGENYESTKFQNSYTTLREFDDLATPSVDRFEQKLMNSDELSYADLKSGESSNFQSDYDLFSSISNRHEGVRFRLNSLPPPGSQKYDLIIAINHLLFPEEKRAGESEKRLKSVLDLLAPGGVLVLIERGNLLGFERIARAREVILRPKGPRVSLFSEERLHKQFSKDIKSDLSRKLFTIRKNDEYELEFSPIPDNASPEERLRHTKEEQEIKKLVNNLNGSSKPISNTSWRVIAPCAHHQHCPLQLRTIKDKKYVRRTWCHFPQMLQKPRWLIDLKRGKELSSRWTGNNSSTNGHPHKKFPLAGKGRSSSRNHEVAQLSYLIVQSKGNDENNTLLPDIETLQESLTWPRLIASPQRRDKHAVMDVCSPRGYIERWTVSKGLNSQAYHDARKASWGDLWPHDAKSKVPRAETGFRRNTDLENEPNSKFETNHFPIGQEKTWEEEFEKFISNRGSPIILNTDPDYEEALSRFGERVTDGYWRRIYGV
ncbi:uncharacterized protein V1516DRAFT_680068 [Lipomyces oligophaga]|uniref:uncharacterized protein n=1 Tax=Lipomyces oligophaga TaxID=45792 RepID=UPI0034CF5C85